MRTSLLASPSGRFGARRPVAGRWLRGICLVTAALAVTLFALGLPEYSRRLQTVCAAQSCVVSPSPEQALLLGAAGLSLRSAAAYRVSLLVFNALMHILVGAVIFWRRPADRVAWYTALTLIAFGTFGVQDAEVVQAIAKAFHPAWRLLAYALTLGGAAALALFYLVFPDGRVTPAWLRWPVAAWVVWLVVSFFFPGAWFDIQYWPLLLNILYYAGLLATAAYAQLHRFRNVSDARQRQQTKWAVFGSVAAPALGLVTYILTSFAAAAGLWAEILSFAQATSYYYFLPLMPLFIGVAILRSHLWDIDVIIRRTLVYSTLTSLLAAVYLGSIVALQALLRGVIGGDSQAAIVFSTLLIAALFGPLRARIQRVIDRAFYRRKYDAARTLAAFGTQARDETDLERLSARLEKAVEETMQPEHVGLWLRPGNGRRRAE